MHNDLVTSVNANFPEMLELLDSLVRIPSVSAQGYDPADVRRSAEATKKMLADEGFSETSLLEIEGAHPAVYGEIPAPPGAPTILLYAHHDVQPPGPPHEWTSPAFVPETRDGRMYGRGTSDDKSGIVVHLGAVRAHGGKPPVGIKAFIEGEEEIGSTHLEQFLVAFEDKLTADAIVICDAGNWKVGVPALTVSLRGLVDCIVEVRTLDSAVHSGLYGGTVPDALTCLSRLLATLHDDEGNVAVAGLVSGGNTPIDMSEEEFRQAAGAVGEVELLGSGSITERQWMRPAISILAIDAPPVEEAINQLVPSARAKVSLRVAPGEDPDRAMDALVAHLESNVPWQAHVTIKRGSRGLPFSLDSVGPAYDAYRQAFEYAWDTAPVAMGAGGSIPFVAAFSNAFPDASILLTGAGEPQSAIHAPNESQHVDDLRRAIIAEAVALRLLADPDTPE